MRIRTQIGAGALIALAAAAPGAAADAAQTPPHGVLVAVRAAGHTTHDRVVFEFRGTLPATRRVRYVDRLVQDGSGALIPMPGRAILQVTMSFANAHDAGGRPTAPAELTYNLRNVMKVRRAGDFEAVVTYGIGVAQRRPFTVRTLTNPNRVVVDVDNRFPTVVRHVWFQNLPNFASGRRPDTVSVGRRVPRSAPATGVLDRLYAGPTAGEAARGLRLVRSRSTGFRQLRITGGTADVRLVGGCSSGGSTYTVANLMMPSLRQFPTVDAVRIRDPQGRTEPAAPGGDSIPVCLEP